MVETRDLLVELGTEELPPTNLRAISDVFANSVAEGLARASLGGSHARAFATPRRLAVLVSQVALQQPAREIERKGPAVSAAFAGDGTPTAAAIGFARSCGAEIDQLQTLESDRGAWLVHRHVEGGKGASELIPRIVSEALERLPFAKRMRWGIGTHEFARPVRWLLMLHGEHLVPGQILGLESEPATRGHRFHHPTALPLQNPNDYSRVLTEKGKVVPDFQQRRELIVSQAHEAAASVAGRVRLDDKLVDEVTALVEWPVAVVGRFDERFLEIPHEVLTSTMQQHQRYFPVLGADHRLLPYFITFSNIESRDVDQVRAGNERVIRPRFADAEFFWEQDRMLALESRRDRLAHVTFEQQLGSVLEKSDRIVSLAEYLADSLGSRIATARRAAALSKCDLVTHMVFEFPELQGVMGRYYAENDGEDPEVATAIEEHYLPRHAGEALPQSATGQILALADRVDTLAGIFVIGKQPTGTKDPYALRRAALAVLRILIECRLDLDLRELVERAVDNQPTGSSMSEVSEAIFNFVMDRLRSYYSDQGFRADECEAVESCAPDRPLDFDRRIRALAKFDRLEEAASLSAANKRIRNILRSVEYEVPSRLDSSLLGDGAEQRLAAALAELASEVIPIMDAGHYEDALLRMARLRGPVDEFFDQVMVMVEDVNLRNNRLALLNELQSLFLRAADLSKLHL